MVSYKDLNTLIKESGKYRITHLKIEIKHLLTFMMNIVPAPR